MRLAMMALLLTGAAFTTALAEDRNDFSGTWKMDAARSESAHQDTRVGASTLAIQITGSTLTMETNRTASGAASAFHEKLELALDGTETNLTGDGGVPVKAKARWDGNKLVVETIRNIHDSTVTTIYVHTLNANAHELTVDKTLTIQHGYQGTNAPNNSGHGKDVFVKVTK